MGAVPKSKISNRRRKNKRSHHALTPPHLMDCPQCGAKKLPHRVCLNCGHYRGVQVLEV
jgi:large subunit ribosomal protein L32